MTTPLRRTAVLLLVLGTAVVLSSTLTVHANMDNLIDIDDNSGVITLVDDNFDPHVFPKQKGQGAQSWFILFFAPWCAHCKSMIPVFSNSSRFLTESGLPHAKFAAVNVAKNSALGSRFDIEAYPTFVYTTGKGKQWYNFHGGYSADSFVQFAVYLQRGVLAGSFADIVSDPQTFMQVEQQMGDTRVPMFVYVPPTSEGKKDIVWRQREARQARWNTAVDAAVSLGNIRFGVLYADDIPEDWAEQGGTSSYVTILKTARGGCKGTGPDGEIFIVHSDAHRTPQCYEESPWLAENSGVEKKKSNSKNGKDGDDGNDEKDIVHLHPRFVNYLTTNGFRAVEEVTGSFFSVVSSINHYYLGLLLTNGTLPQSDTTIMPVLRDVVQGRNAARIATATAGVVGDTAAGNSAPKCRISLAHADIVAQPILGKRYNVLPEEVPAFIVADPRREKVYRLRLHTPRFEEIKLDVPWKIGGEQGQIIAQFLHDVEQGEAHGEKMSSFGGLSELLLKLPGMEFVYETLNYDDGLFIAMFLGLMFFLFLLFLGLVVEPLMGPYPEEHKKRD